MAIVVTPKLANLPDVTTTTPSDGQVLTYDDASGKWVNEDAASGGGVTDHGALTGLADDDHSQYLLATGARTGGSSAAQTFTNGIIGPSWKPASNSTTALQLQNAAGTSIVNLDTTNSRVGIGTTTPGNGISLDTKLHVVGSGASTGGRTVFIMQNTNATSAAQFQLRNAAGKSLVLQAAGASYPVPDLAAVGSEGGMPLAFATDGEKANGGTSNILFYAGGYNASQIRLSIDAPTGYVGINTTSPTSQLHALINTSNTNSITTIGTLTHNSTGTPAAGFGAGLLFQLETTTTVSQDAAQIAASWSDATHATRAADLVFSTVNSGGSLSEKLRLTGAGILKFSGTMGNSTKVPGTDAPADWIEVQIGSDTRYIPVYAAS